MKHAEQDAESHTKRECVAIVIEWLLCYCGQEYHKASPTCAILTVHHYSMRILQNPHIDLSQQAFGEFGET